MVRRDMVVVSPAGRAQKSIFHGLIFGRCRGRSRSRGGRLSRGSRGEGGVVATGGRGVEVGVGVGVVSIAKSW